MADQVAVLLSPRSAATRHVTRLQAKKWAHTLVLAHMPPRAVLQQQPDGAAPVVLRLWAPKGSSRHVTQQLYKRLLEQWHVLSCKRLRIQLLHNRRIILYCSSHGVKVLLNSWCACTCRPMPYALQARIATCT